MAAKIFRYSSHPSSSGPTSLPPTPTTNAPSLLSTLTLASLGRRSTSERSIPSVPSNASNPTTSASTLSNTSNSPNTIPSTPVTTSPLNSPILHPVGTVPNVGAWVAGLVGQSYVEKISLELAEKGNRIMSRGGGVDREKARDFASRVEMVLTTSLPDLYLLRALLRSAVSRSLSVLLSRLSTVLLPLLSDSKTSSLVFNLPNINGNIPTQQKISLDVAFAAYQVGGALERVCHEIRRLKNVSHSAAGDPTGTLEGWKDKFEEITNKVLLPTVDGVKRQLSALCGKGRFDEDLRHYALDITNGGGILNGQPPSRSVSPHVNRNQSSTSNTGGGVGAPCQLPTSAPAYIKELNQLLMTIKHFLLVRLNGSMTAPVEPGGLIEKWMVSLGTGVIWKAMLNWSARKIPSSAGTSTPMTVGNEGGAVTMKREEKTVFGGRIGGRTIFGRGGASNVMSVNRAPSPPGQIAEREADERLVWEMGLVEKVVRKFVEGVVDDVQVGLVIENVDMNGKDRRCPIEKGCLICKGMGEFGLHDSEEDEGDNAGDGVDGVGRLARQAMLEAEEALKAVMVLVRGCQYPRQILELLGSKKSPLSCQLLAEAFDVAPPLITLYLLHSRLPNEIRRVVKAPHEVWGMEWERWEQVMRGFAVAEEWTEDVAELLEQEVAFEISKEAEEGGIENIWVDILRFAVERLVDQQGDDEGPEA